MFRSDGDVGAIAPRIYIAWPGLGRGLRGAWSCANICSMSVEQAQLEGLDATAGRRPRRERIVGKRSEATILHADLDSFYASVEQRDDPSLRGKPITVGGGVVLAASYEAKRFGVRAAMSGGEARRLCPNLIDVPARFDAYVEASKAVYAIFDDTTPIVEPMSIDEAFLDVAGLWRLVGTPRVIAERLRHRVADEVGLPITVGVARTKFLAKVASGVGKPDGLLVVEPEGELAFLHPLPVERLWGVGADHRHEAERPRRVHRRRGGSDGRAGAHRDRRSERRLASPRLGPQSRSPPSGGRTAAGIDRLAAGLGPPTSLPR